MVAIRIRVLNNGPWKIKFLPNTPSLIQTRIKAVILAGKKGFVPEDVVPYIDLGYLKVCQERGVIQYQELRRPPKPTPVKAKSPKAKSLIKEVEVEEEKPEIKGKSKSKKTLEKSSKKASRTGSSTSGDEQIQGGK